MSAAAARRVEVATRPSLPGTVGTPACARRPCGQRPCRPSGGSSRLRPDENQAGRLDGVGEIGVLGEETVAGMDGVDARRGGREEDASMLR